MVRLRIEFLVHLLHEGYQVSVEAGLLTSDFNERSLPSQRLLASGFIYTRCSYQLQWRDRAGISPASLFSPF